MPSFKIDLSTAVAFVAVPPSYKVVNRETGEIAIDRETKGKMMTVGLTIADDGTADLLTVNVPESGVPANLGVGMPVAVTGLRARDWENDFNGQKRHGISFRALAVTSLAPVAAKG
ncbi:SCO3933 family regulatory protein [Streptacidiphilus cavernicola]|uniref:Regulatory protein n=1 Tax=Streptacidiphilus cavernicola TaxID=3342716 RepID=A0ABV6VS38_9ACTN